MKFSAQSAEGGNPCKKFFASKKSRYLIRQIMRLSFVLAIITFATSSLIFASDTKGQSISNTEVVLGLNHESVFSAIEKIQKQTPFIFIYRNTDLKELKEINIPVQKRTVQELLDVLFNSKRFKITQLNNRILISSIKPEVKAVPVDIRISGIVVDEDGIPIPGVSIMLKQNNKVSTATDRNGQFGINLPDEGTKVLLFTCIGYQNTEQVIGSENSYKIVMKPSVGSLNEIQIIGYGTTTRKMSTGSIASITAKEIEKQPVGNPLAALSGRMSGVLIAQNNGVPGGAIQVQIRGQNSLSSGGIPLYVIDGVPFTNFNGGQPATDNLNAFGTSGASGGISPFSMINPSDIERIDILKDADATSIYGSRGANGVVLITTKKGKSGKVKIGLNLNTGFTEVNRFIPVLDLEQYLALRTEAFKNDGATPNSNNAPDLTVWDRNSSTDFQKMFIGNRGHINEIQASMSGGNEQTRFFFNSA